MTIIHVRLSLKLGMYTMALSNMFRTKVYTFSSLLALDSTHIFCGAPNFTSTFFTLIVILLSFVDWRHG